MLPVENLIIDSTAAVSSALEDIGSTHNASIAAIYAYTPTEGKSCLIRHALWTKTPRVFTGPSRIAFDFAAADEHAYRNLLRNIPLAGLARDHPLLKAFFAEKTQSFVIVPLVLQGAWGGVIVCEFDDAHYLMAADLSSLMESAVKISSSLLRKQNIELIRVENEAYHVLLEQVNDLILRVDENLIIRSVEGHATRINGFPADHDILGRAILEFLHPDDIPHLIEQLARLREGRHVSDYRLAPRHGEVRWVRVISYPIHANGTYTGLWCCLMDISDLHTTIDDLKERERKHLLLIDHAPAGIFTLDRDFHPISISPSCMRVWGSSVEDLPSPPTHAQPLSIPAPVLESLRAHFSSADVPAPQPACLVCDLMMPDGSMRSVELRASHLGEDLPTSLGVIGIVSDITARQRKDRERETLAMRQRYLTENIKDVLVCYDADGVITYVSDNIQELSGYPPGEIVGMSAAQIIHPDFLPQISNNLLKLRQGEDGVLEYPLRRRDGSCRWVRLHYRPLYGQGRINEVLGVLVDIDQYKQIEQHQQASEKAENVYQQIIEQMPSLVWVTDKHLITTYVSPSIEAILGYTVAEAKLMEMGMILKRDSFKVMVEVFDEAMCAAGGQDREWFKDIVIWQKRANGRIIKGSLRLSLLFDGPSHIGYLGITTFRKKGDALRGRPRVSPRFPRQRKSPS